MPLVVAIFFALVANHAGVVTNLASPAVPKDVTHFEYVWANTSRGSPANLPEVLQWLLVSPSVTKVAHEQRITPLPKLRGRALEHAIEYPL
jgi:hypothetical protein